MSNSNSGKIRLIVSAAYPTEEIYVLSQSLKEVASSVGTLTEQLPPGIYKVRYVAGSQSAEKIVELNDELPEVRVPHPNLNISSPIFCRGREDASVDPGSLLASRMSTRITSQQRTRDSGELLVVIRVAQPDEGKTFAAVRERGVTLKLYDRFGAEISDLGAKFVQYRLRICDRNVDFAMKPKALNRTE